ncbi:MAG: diguanylate cyclase [Planctomycetes bacterium]|nr:diguanylate cyclase [Planctomycetota bacterium]
METTPSVPRTLLIVDDTPANIEILSSVLEAEHQILFATSGRDALELVASQIPDLILLDIMMPEMDGYEVCKRLKADPKTHNVPVIFITALSEEADETRGLEVGAIDYISKPISAPIVKARVRNHLELKRFRDMLEDLSARDGLTGIANRRRLDEFLTQEWLRGGRNQSPLSVCLIDIDFFKRFNDRYGHAAGDDCLRRVALALASVSRRPADLVARYGGEEFVCALPDTDAAGAALLADRFREAVIALGIPHADSSIAELVTISGGVATAIPTGESAAAQLLEAADRMLYQAKKAGRNRVLTPPEEALHC